VEQIFGAQESTTAEGESVYQAGSVVVLYSSGDRALRVTFALDVDELVFDRPAANQLAEYYRPPGATLQQTELLSPDRERLTYATPALAAFLLGQDTGGRDPGVYIEEFVVDLTTDRVLQIVTSLGMSP
jgi:hypothetical protein